MFSSIYTAAECEPLMTPVRQLYLHLTSFPTATAALAAWLSARCLNSDPVRAHVIGQINCNARTSCGGAIVTRCVRLVCGSHVLSEATIVYREYVLSEELRNQLRSTDLPFGEVIASLGPSRRTTFARAVGAPIISELCITGNAFKPLLEIHATVSTAEYGPVARVRETYGAYLLLMKSSPLEHAHDMPRNGARAQIGCSPSLPGLRDACF